MTYEMLMHQARCEAMIAAEDAGHANEWLGNCGFKFGPKAEHDNVTVYASLAGVHYRRAHELYDRAERVRRRLRDDTLNAAANHAIRIALGVRLP